MDHLNTHSEMSEKNFSCRKCQNKKPTASFMKHYYECNKTGPFNCVYCKESAMDFATLDHHISEYHTSNLPVFCERKVMRKIEDRSKVRLTIRS